MTKTCLKRFPIGDQNVNWTFSNTRWNDVFVIFDPWFHFPIFTILSQFFSVRPKKISGRCWRRNPILLEKRWIIRKRMKCSGWTWPKQFITSWTWPRFLFLFFSSSSFFQIRIWEMIRWPLPLYASANIVISLNIDIKKNLLNNCGLLQLNCEIIRQKTHLD